MRLVLTLLSLLLGVGAAQEVTKTNQPKLIPSAPASAEEITIPAGTKIPVALKNAISTKSNQQGDPVYAQTTFPVVLNDRIVIPAGTYMQGRIMQVKPA